MNLDLLTVEASEYAGSRLLTSLRKKIEKWESVEIKELRNLEFEIESSEVKLLIEEIWKFYGP